MTTEDLNNKNQHPDDIELIQAQENIKNVF
jgi:hypothetical protein